jgi:ABC-2 type transport system ATP-binding protein
MAYVGALKRRVNESESSIRKRGNHLLSILGLRPYANTMVSDLSKGQRKLLSIGIGLIGQPKVLFLDEPTTGLDR